MSRLMKFASIFLMILLFLILSACQNQEDKNEASSDVDEKQTESGENKVEEEYTQPESDANKQEKENAQPEVFQLRNEKYYIHGITLGDDKDVVLEKLGEPDEEKEDSSELNPADYVLSFDNLEIYITDNQVVRMFISTNQGYFNRVFYDDYPNPAEKYISEDGSMYYLYKEETEQLIYAKLGENDEFMIFFDYADGNFQHNLETGWIKNVNSVDSSSADQDQVSYAPYGNSRFGFTFEYPQEYTVDPPPTNGDGVTIHNEDFKLLAYGGHTNILRDGETVNTYYEEDLAQISVPISYNRLKDNWYVLSYKEGELINYKKFFFSENAFNTFLITYPASKQDLYGPITTHISESFVPGF
ncbi:hypothetical protein SAMN05192533_101523 [Mesobacillus persicus]|uniref:Uncharacterized protein n=1 Tax=Mesobacillus persicus TaxID=930146 RepID=A0A1H7WP38_9BACI|nr:hypothetical protein [Mesobacillus persicus]SEM23124.1 hypothetical protein SAMN05192533_101523 [Mesobacillus persicus]